MQEIFNSYSLNNTENIAREVAGRLKKGDFIALYGEMGAGKTAFVRGLVKEILPECLPLVHSPTFAVVNEYAGKNLTVWHFDFYRLKDRDDLYSTGFYDYRTGENIIVTEWSGMFPDAVPDDAVRVTIGIEGENSRRIEVCWF